MKTVKLLIIAAFFAVAQKGYTQNCPDEVSTDPRNPNNPDRPNLENTFFWFPHGGNDHNSFEFLTSGGTYPSINSPFWNPTSLMVGQLVNLQNSDFYPEDGWELLKVNFGRLNDGTPRVIKPSMPYMILYNRYSGTMRFLGMWPDASNSWQIIRFKIGIPEYKWTSQPNTTGDPLQATNLLSVQGDAIQPLDQQTEETIYEVITEYPGISNASFFFWFDLPVAYDPCICNSDVAIQLEATVENQWDVTVKGVLDAQVIQQGVPQSGYSSLVTKRVIGAAGATVAAIATGGAVINTGAFTGLLDIFSQRPGVAGDTESAIELLQGTLSAAAEVTYDSSKLEWRNTVTGETLTKKDWEKLFSGIGSFLNAGVDFANPGSQSGKPKTSVVGSITATGTATLNQNPGDLVYLGLPGSNWTETLDEIIESASNGLNPEYPIYNNPLGTVALLETPEINVREWPQVEKYASYGVDPQTQEEGCIFSQNSSFEVYFSGEMFKYAINPALNINLDESEILASIVIKPKDGASFYEYTTFIPEDFCYPGHIAYEQEIAKGQNLLITIDDSEMYTVPLPFDYINEIRAVFSADGIVPFNYFDYFIRLNIDLESHNLNKDGTPNRVKQILTFPLNPNYVSPSLTEPFLDLVNDSFEVNYDQPEQFNSGEIAFADEYIEISDHVYSDDQELASILSSAVIHLKPGAQVSRKMRLAIDYPFQGLFPQEEVSPSYLSDFCANNLTDVTYQANQFSAFAPQLPPPSQEYLEKYYRIEQVLNRIVLSPNPARDLLTLRSSHLDMTSVTIYDLSGRPIKQETLQAHSRETQINLSGVAPGTYIVRVDCGDEVFSEKLVVTR